MPNIERKGTALLEPHAWIFLSKVSLVISSAVKTAILQKRKKMFGVSDRFKPGNAN